MEQEEWVEMLNYRTSQSRYMDGYREKSILCMQPKMLPPRHRKRKISFGNWSENKWSASLGCECCMCVSVRVNVRACVWKSECVSACVRVCMNVSERERERQFVCGRMCRCAWVCVFGFQFWVSVTVSACVRVRVWECVCESACVGVRVCESVRGAFKTLMVFPKIALDQPCLCRRPKS